MPEAITTATEDHPDGDVTAIPEAAPEATPQIAARFAVRTHVGLVREANEDDYLVVPEMGLYLVADGMGGHVAGKVASDLCVRSIQEYFANGGLTGKSRLVDEHVEGLSRDAVELAESLLVANRKIYDLQANDRQYAGMGTTAVGIRVFKDHVAISHAGDSRCYLYREGTLQQVTTDHSLSNFLFALGRDMEARFAEQTMSNVIMRALGLEADVAVDTKEFKVRPGDRFVICSDGLSDLVPPRTLAERLTDPTLDRDGIVDSLVQLALDAGGRDNITVILVDIVEASAPEDLQGSTLQLSTVE